MTTAPERDRPFSYRDGRRLLVLVVFLILGWILLRALVPVLLLFAIVFLVAIILNPLVVWLEKFHLPRPISVLSILTAVLALVILVGALVVPAFIEQVQALLRQAPLVWRGVREHLADLASRYPALQNALPQADEIAATIGKQAGAAATILLRSTITIVSGVFVFVFAVLLLIFVLANPRPLVVAYLALAPERHRGKARRTLVRMMAAAGLPFRRARVPWRVFAEHRSRAGGVPGIVRRAQH